jgi:cell filamentation protein
MKGPGLFSLSLVLFLHLEAKGVVAENPHLNPSRRQPAKTLEDAETILLTDTYRYFLDLLAKEKLSFTVKVIFKIHEYFLGALYSWAGKTRSVNISKNGMLFARPQNIKKYLKEFEKILKINLSKAKENKKELALNLAIIHCEFNAIHPFREGNGRTIRLFLDLIAIENGYKTISFNKEPQKKYIEACIAGMQKDYTKMSKLIYKGLQKR